MKITDMANLFTAYDKTEDFRIAVCAADKEEAMQIAEEYRFDSGLKGAFEVSGLTDGDTKFDCDYVITRKGNVAKGVGKDIGEHKYLLIIVDENLGNTEVLPFKTFEEAHGRMEDETDGYGLNYELGLDDIRIGMNGAEVNTHVGKIIYMRIVKLY